MWYLISLCAQHQAWQRAASVFVDDSLALFPQVPMSEGCKQAVMRLTGCPFCRGVPSLPPCRGFCLNVAHGCLSSQGLDPDWGPYLGEDSGKPGKAFCVGVNGMDWEGVLGHIEGERGESSPSQVSLFRSNTLLPRSGFVQTS